MFAGVDREKKYPSRNVTGITGYACGIANEGPAVAVGLPPITCKPATAMVGPLPKATQLVLWRLGMAAELQLQLEGK